MNGTSQCGGFLLRGHIGRGGAHCNPRAFLRQARGWKHGDATDRGGACRGTPGLILQVQP
jgi:hypothetical protein